MSLPKQAAIRLAHLDSCALSDALDKLELAGTVTGIHAVSAPQRIAGRVVTVKLGPAGESKPERHLCTEAIEHAAIGDVIVIEHHARDDVAGWGGLLSTAAKIRGVEGTIVDGTVRDVDESSDVRYTVYARSVVPFTARGRVVEEAWNVPVTIGSVSVSPGDLVIADGSGVVFLQAARALELLDLAEQIADREASMAQAVRRGTPVSQVMGGSYETMLEDEKDG